MKEMHEEYSEEIHDEHLNEQQKRDLQRRLRLFKRLPLICGLGFIPLIVISLLVLEVFGLRMGVSFFFVGVGFLVYLAVAATYMRRKFMSGAIVPARRRKESVVGPRLRLFIIVLFILIVPFGVMVFLADFLWIGFFGLLILVAALNVVRFYITWKKRQIHVRKEN